MERLRRLASFCVAVSWTVPISTAHAQRVPRGTLHVIVVDAKTLSPVVNATTHVGQVQRIDCDRAGICHDHVVTGTYHVATTAPGYVAQDARVVITEGSETELGLHLKKRSKDATNGKASPRKAAPKQPHTQVKRQKKKKDR